MKYLGDTRQAFVESITGISDAQWTFKAGPDRWSIAEAAEHIAVSEGTILQLITERVVKGPTVPADPARPSDQKVVEVMTDRLTKAQAPEMLKPTNRWSTREALIKDFLANRQKTIDYVKTTTVNLRGHAAPHPALGMIDGYQWVLLVAAHSARHTAQIQEVKTSTRYPQK